MEYIKLNFPYCIYCGEPPEHWDHAFPLSRSWMLLSGFISWLVPSCAECNQIAKARIFKTFGDKTTYIKERLKEKYINELESFRIQARIDWEIKTLKDESIVTKIMSEEAIVLDHNNKPTREERETIVGKRHTKEQRTREERTCKNCKELFMTRHGHQLHCNIECTRAWNKLRQRQVRDATPKKYGKCKYCCGEFVKRSSRQNFCQRDSEIGEDSPCRKKFQGEEASRARRKRGARKYKKYKKR